MITKARVIGGTAMAAAAMAAAFGAAPSQAEYGGDSSGITIKAVFDGKLPRYAGPSKISRGATLTFLNASDPEKIGPHTFSLVEKDIVPEVKSKKDANQCFKAGLCGAIAVAHEYDPETDEVNKSSVSKGRGDAWDKPFRSFEKFGDSFYTEEEGGTETRKVIEPVGTKLTFFCAVHPEMVKTIKVVD